MGKRMYYVLKILLESNNIIAAKDIQIILEEKYNEHIDIKTVRAIINQINDFFYEIIDATMITTIHKRGYIIENTFFTNAQIQFLLDTIASQSDLQYDDKQELTDTLLSFVPEHIQDELLWGEVKEDHKTFSILRNIQTIQKAIHENKMIVFNYITYDIVDNHLEEINSKGGNETNNPYNYLVSPYKIINTNNHYYLIAFNSKYQKLVNYRIDRMRRILVKRRVRYDFPEDVDLENEIKKTINMYSLSNEVADLELEIFNQNTLREVVSRFEDRLPATKTYNGHYQVRIKDVQINDGLKGWLLMMQDQIKVISPLSLVSSQKEMLEKMINLYK